MNPTGTGGWKKGESGNPGGRPKKGQTIVEKFRDNPLVPEIIDKILNIAATLGTNNESPHALDCAKEVLKRIVPTLKVQEIRQADSRLSGIILVPMKQPVPKRKEDLPKDNGGIASCVESCRIDTSKIQL